MIENDTFMVLSHVGIVILMVEEVIIQKIYVMAKLKIKLKNRNVELPDDVGNFILSTGCGSGKTYWLERFILTHYMEGMLIIVDSIVSANSLYFDLLTKLGLDANDMMLIHSKIDYDVLNEYANNPEEVTKKKVLIMTNVRLYTEYPPVYLLYNKNGVTLSSFDGDWKKLMNNPNTRRWIIIDEIPGFIQKYATVSKLHLGVLGETDDYGGYKAKEFIVMEKDYNTFIAHSDAALFATTTALGKLKTDSALYIIKHKYLDMMKVQGDAVIQFSPCDFQTNNSLVLIMEGAGDVLFKDSSIYQLIDIPNKYSAKADFHSFNVPSLSRRSNNQEELIKSMVKAVIAILSSVKGKTLIACWNDFKGEDKGITSDTQNSKDSHLVALLSEELTKANIPLDSYSIIYYGSAESKAVNDFKDYSNIILLGKWSLPVSTSSEKFNKAFLTNTTLTRYMLWEYVQLITRIAIRQDRDINVFYSDDHNKDFMLTLEKYFNQNILDIPEEHIDWRDKVKKLNNGKRIVSQIERLSQRFPYIPQMIVEDNQNKTINVSLKEVNNLIGKNKKRRDYKLLISILQKFGISLVLQ